MVPDGQPGKDRGSLPRVRPGRGPQGLGASTRSRGRGFLCFVILLLAFASAASAPQVSARDKASKDKKGEQPYALIYGTVWSAEGTPVYGVAVKIRRADEAKARWQLVSNHLGEFAQRVPAGKADYVVWAEIKVKGRKAQKPEVRVHIENDERADISLHLTE